MYSDDRDDFDDEFVDYEEAEETEANFRYGENEEYEEDWYDDEEEGLDEDIKNHLILRLRVWYRYSFLRNFVDWAREGFPSRQDLDDIPF